MFWRGCFKIRFLPTRTFQPNNLQFRVRGSPDTKGQEIHTPAPGCLADSVETSQGLNNIANDLNDILALQGGSL